MAMDGNIEKSNFGKIIFFGFDTSRSKKWGCGRWGGVEYH